MNKYLNKHFNMIFTVFIIIQPFIDVLTPTVNTNLPITIGIIIRTLFLLFILYYSLFVEKTNIKNKLIILTLTGIYSLLYLTNIVISKDISVLFTELQFLVKIFYFPLLLFYIPKVQINKKLLVNMLVIYSLLIFIPTIFNINLDAYTQGKVGSAGWFNSANSVSAIISILLPILLMFTFNKKIHNKLYLLCVIPLFMIGSKFTIIALVFSLLLILIHSLPKIKMTKTKLSLTLISVVIIIVTSIIFIPKTSFYKNIIIHADFLGINEVTDLFHYDAINRFIFSDRLTYLEETNNNYINADLSDKLLGIGTIENYNTENERNKMIEMDVFDIFYRLGIIGFIIYLTIIITIIKKIDINCNFEYKISLLLIILLIFLVGHTLSEPSVSIYITIIILNTLKQKATIK